MSVNFVIASSQLLEKASAPLTAVPVTVGMWFNMDAAGTLVQQLWGLQGSASTNMFMRLTLTASETLSASTKDSGTTASAATLTTVCNAKKWIFVVARFITAANRRISAIFENGAIEHANNTTSRTPTGIDIETLGGRKHSSTSEFFGGQIAEFWVVKGDVQTDTGDLKNHTLRQLAYRGPFSLPNIAKDIVEYRSFRQTLVSDRDVGSEVYWSDGYKRPVWTNTNACTLAYHPPLTSEWRKPADARPNLAV